MLDQRLLPRESDLKGLRPEKTTLPCGNLLYLFHSPSVDILKLDFLFGAGSAVQPKPLCAGLARDMLLDASPSHTVSYVAEQFDRLGVVIDRQSTSFSTKLSVYTLKKYTPLVFPLLCDLLSNPLFGSDEFDVLIAKRRQTLLTDQMKTSAVARNLFLQTLYGTSHPYGRFAVPGDENKISLDEVRMFAKERLSLDNATLILSGNYDGETLKLIDSCFGSSEKSAELNFHNNIVPNPDSLKHKKVRRQIQSSVQSTLRIGRILPIEWHDPDYPMFIILNTVLGGYFGSRLMSNIREDKGYTYGVNSFTNMMRDSSVFCISTDVANDAVDAACDEIYKEIDILRHQPVPDDELSLVCNYMAGDFLRSIDGIFERSERFYTMLDANVDERFTTNYFQALRTVTPEKLMAMADAILSQSDLTEVIVGA